MPFANLFYFLGSKDIILCGVNWFWLIFFFAKMVKNDPFCPKRHKMIDFEWLGHVDKIIMIMVMYRVASLSAHSWSQFLDLLDFHIWSTN